jgi:outer membrane protein
VVVQKQAVELAERLVEENKRRLEVGAMAPLELQSAEAQAAQSRSAVIQAQSQLGTQERLVKRFISDDFASWVDVEIQPTESLTATHQYFDRQDSWAKALEQRPDLQSQRLSVESQGIQLKYNRNQLYPELDVFGSFGYNGAGKEFSDALYQVQQRDLPTYTFGGQISLPLANTSARKSYKAAKATLEQMLLGLKDNEQAIMSEVDNDIGTIQASYEQVLATRAAREYSEAALKAEQLKFQNGKSTLYTVLQMQRDLTSSRGDEIQALDNYNKLIARLSLNEGSTFERLGITWESK